MPAVRLKRNEITSFVQEKVLDHITYPYTLVYESDEIYRSQSTEMEYRLGFKNSDNIMLIRVRYTPIGIDDVDVNMVVLAAPLQGEHLYPVLTISRDYEEQLKMITIKVVNKLFQVPGYQ